VQAEFLFGVKLNSLIHPPMEDMGKVCGSKQKMAAQPRRRLFLANLLLNSISASHAIVFSSDI